MLSGCLLFLYETHFWRGLLDEPCRTIMHWSRFDVAGADDPVLEAVVVAQGYSAYMMYSTGSGLVVVGAGSDMFGLRSH